MVSAGNAIPTCPLCGRPIPADVLQSQHHLVPKSKGGRKSETVLLHDICHREIHSSLKETEIARTYNTIAALRAHPRLAKFIDWVAKRPPEFTSVVPGSTSIRRR